MATDFKVSVIIPVYNASGFVRRAVESAFALPEVAEILLIEDGSKDNSLELCRQLEKEFYKVRLLTHENNANRGAGASRNLGLSNASSEFIAFLDADDFYCVNRFVTARAILEHDPSVDGVYEATGVYYYSTTGKEKFLASKGMSKNDGRPYLTMLTKVIEPNDLCEALISGKYKGFTTDAITLRRSIFDVAGNFNEQLRLHQDSELWIRIAYHGKLVSGNRDEPVAMRGVHDDNRIVGSSSQSRSQFYCAIFEYFVIGRRKISFRTYLAIVRKYVIHHPGRRYANSHVAIRRLEVCILFISAVLLKR